MRQIRGQPKLTGGGNGYWVWVPSNPSPAAASAGTGIRSEDGDHYSKTGFGPKLN
jgi:hypothetical protein